MGCGASTTAQTPVIPVPTETAPNPQVQESPKKPLESSGKGNPQASSSVKMTSSKSGPKINAATTKNP